MVDFISSCGPPLVSIIIPCWNAECYVGEAIESALAQTYPNVEVIVIDDGSTDGSLEVIQSFGERIRWETEPNRGACAARNRGIALARGKLIQFLDADDLLYPRKLELQVPISMKYADAIVYCDRESYFMEHPDRKWMDAPSCLPDPVLFSLSKIIANCTALYYRDTLLYCGGYREDLPCAQDYELHLRLAITGWSYKKIPEVLVTVRRRSESVSSDSLKVINQMRSIWDEAFEQLKELNQLTDERRLAIASCIAGVGRVYLKQSHYQMAYQCFEEALNIHPQGVDMAYDRPARLLKKIAGPVLTEHLVLLKRRIFNRSNRPG